MIIQFHDIAEPLSVWSTQGCIQQAVAACTAHRISGQGLLAVGPDALSYNAGTVPDAVHFVLVPGPALIWINWARLALGIASVQVHLEYKELQFSLMWELSPGQLRIDGVGRIWGGLSDKID